MHFLIYKGTDGQWRWCLRAGNNEIIADGAEGYRRRIDAMHGIELVKLEAANAPVFSTRRKPKTAGNSPVKGEIDEHEARQT